MAIPRLHIGSDLRFERSISVSDEDLTSCRDCLQMSTQTAKLAHGAMRRSSKQRSEHADDVLTTSGDDEEDVLDKSSDLNAIAEGALAYTHPVRQCRHASEHREESSSLKIRSARRRSSLGHASSTASEESVHQCHKPQVTDPSGERLRKDLRFFFLNPVEKCRIRRSFPWKFSLQLLKIVVVSAQVIMFGDMRMNHVDFIGQSVSALRHFMLKNWEEGRDVNTYPPSFPPYATYDIESLYELMTHASRQYYKLNTSAFGLWMYGSNEFYKNNGLLLCINEFAKVDFDFENNTYFLDTDIKSKCINIKIESSDALANFSMHNYLQQNNISMHHKKFISASLSFGLKCVHLRRSQISYYSPDCFFMKVDIIFDNEKHNGKVFVELKSSLEYLTCNGSILYTDSGTGFRFSMALIDLSVTLVCLLSLILCLRSLIRGRALRQRAELYFTRTYGVKLTKDEQMMFLNVWYICILVNDIFLIVGVVCKFSIEYKLLGSALFNFTGMLLGLGTLFAWIGILRYLGFFAHYNILILTLKRAMPNVFRFMVCAGLIYMGFLFCGWIILGPYHMKFRDLMTSSECLFALINGDDMFATFTTTSGDSSAVVWFARIYLYVFISLFIYIVLSLFISIIMDAYEIVKDKYHNCQTITFLQDFISQCDEASLKQSMDGHRSGATFISECCGRLISRIRRRSEVPYTDLNREQIDGNVAGSIVT